MTRKIGIARLRTKYIYVVTTIKFGYKYKSRHRHADGLYHSYRRRTHPSQKKYFSTLDQRTWGWFEKLEDAKKAIQENGEDMYENSYSYAVIERIAEGFMGGEETPREWWFKWKGTWKEGGGISAKYKPDLKPSGYHNVYFFGLDC